MEEHRTLQHLISKTQIPVECFVIIGSSDFEGYTAYLYLEDDYYPDPSDEITLCKDKEHITVKFSEITHWDHITHAELHAIKEALIITDDEEAEA